MPDEKPTSERLLEGAKAIGNYYRAGARCATMGWQIKLVEGAESCEVLIDPEELCKCGNKATVFCKAKVKWLMLALIEPREIVGGEFGLALTMSGNEWDATGLILKWEAPMVGPIRIGPKTGVTMKNLKDLMGDPISGQTSLKLMVAFPGATMEFEAAEVKKLEVEAGAE